MVAYLEPPVCTCRAWMKDRGIELTNILHPNPACPFARSLLPAWQRSDPKVIDIRPWLEGGEG